MLTQITNDDGKPLVAKIELHDGAIIIQSRGGAFGKPNLRNPDYSEALRTILARLNASEFTASGVWLDSRPAREWPESERLLVEAQEFALAVADLEKLIGQRAAAKKEPGSKGGQRYKQVKLGVPDASVAQLQALLNGSVAKPPQRLPAATQRLVTPAMIDEAIEAFLAGAHHNFSGSTDYDLLLPSGERLPPKAIFGLALSKVIGRPAKPVDFSAGWGEPCFDIIEDAGYPIVPKNEVLPSTPPDADDERTWAEGSPKRVQHLRRERAPSLARTKKRRFIEQHGHLFCERCGLIPSKALGPLGDACIEVHHSTVAVSKMDGTTRTRLSDLQCLCANCHRITHREQL